MRLDPRAVVTAVRELDRPIMVLAAVAFISSVGVSLMLPLLPLFAIELGATPRELGLMVSVFAVTQTIGQLGSNALLTWVSPRRQLPLGQASYAAANFLIATAQAATPLIVFRGLAGFGGGLSIIADRLYLARVADRARLAYSNGVISAAGSSGSVLGPLFGGILAAIDLRIPFLVVGCTATLAAFAALRFLPAEPPAPPRALATEGVASQGRGLASLRPLVAIGLWNLAFSAAFGGWITTFAPFAEERLGYATYQIPWIFGCFGLGSILFGPWLGRLADRHGRRRMVALGSAAVLLNPVSMLLLAPPTVIFLSAVVAGAGLAAAQSSWFAMLTMATDGGWRGRSFGLVTAISNLGVVAGATVAADIWTRVDVAAALAAASIFIVTAIGTLVFVRSDEHRPTFVVAPG
jgi:MFS family permease